jgi:hypothetical protein
LSKFFCCRCALDVFLMQIHSTFNHVIKEQTSNYYELH